MTEEVYVTAVVDIIHEENGKQVAKIIKGKKYKVFNIENRGSHYVGNIVNEVGHESFILFDGLVCAWQQHRRWIVERGEAKFIPWNEFIGQITAKEFEEMISNYESFRDKGSIGECVLRRKAQEWSANIKTSFSSGYMNDLAMEAYKAMYQYYRRQYLLAL